MKADGLLSVIRANPVLIDQLGVGLSDVFDADALKAQRRQDGRGIVLRTPAPVPKPDDEFSGRGKSTPYHTWDLRRERKLRPEREADYRASHRRTAADPTAWVPHWYCIRNGWAGGYLDDRQALVLLLESLDGGEQLTIREVENPPAAQQDAHVG